MHPAISVDSIVTFESMAEDTGTHATEILSWTSRLLRGWYGLLYSDA